MEPQAKVSKTPLLSENDVPLDKQKGATTAWPLWFGFGCCAFTASIVPGQTLFIEFFAESRVFYALCPEGTHETCDDQILKMTTLLNLVSLLLIPGPFFCYSGFDRVGGQVCGVMGSLTVALSYAGIAFVLSLIPHFPEVNVVLSYSIIFLVGLAQLGAYLNNMALMGMLWHYHEHQSLVFALVNASYQVGGVFAMALQWIMASYGISLTVMLVWWSALQVVACRCLRMLVPSQEEYFSQAERILGTQLPQQHEFQKSVKAAWAILRMDGARHLEMGAAASFGAAFVFYYTSIAVPFGKDLFGSQEAAKRMADLFAIMNTALGMASAPLLGACGDHFGFVVFVYLQLVSILVCAGTCWIKSWIAAIAATASGALYISVQYMITGAWFLYFAPPNQIGMVCGIFNLLSSLIVLLVQICLSFTSQILDEGLSRYIWPLSAGAVTSLLSAAFFFLRFTIANPFPPSQRFLTSEEQDEDTLQDCCTQSVQP